VKSQKCYCIISAHNVELVSSDDSSSIIEKNDKSIDHTRPANWCIALIPERRIYDEEYKIRVMETCREPGAEEDEKRLINTLKDIETVLMVSYSNRSFILFIQNLFIQNLNFFKVSNMQ
jgi:hypothetical protein